MVNENPTKISDPFNHFSVEVLVTMYNPIEYKSTKTAINEKKWYA